MYKRKKSFINALVFKKGMFCLPVEHLSDIVI